MRRWLVLTVLPLALTTAAPLSASRRPTAVTKSQAEVDVLRVAAHRWKARRLHGLVDPQTHLLANNTEAICRGRGRRRAGNRYRRFVCVVRPRDHRRRQGLYVRYRRVRSGFTLRLIRYRSH
jgi:hypothetical protein